MRENSCTCRDAELLISMSLDNECNQQQLGVLHEHLEHCQECRVLEREYARLDALLQDIPPETSFVLSGPPKMPFASRRRALRLRFVRPVFALAASFLLFFAGQHWGHQRATTAKNASETKLDSAYLVSAPSLWLTSRGKQAEHSLYQAETEKPFIERIDKYRLSIGKELRAEEVDWEKVRRLVEAMGELRTDLELLTLHMAYLEIKTGSPASEVAYQWEHLGDKALRRGVIQ